MLIAGGKTYLFGSSNNKWLPVRQITGYRSSLGSSKSAWASSARDAMPSRPAWINPSDRQIWAPSVVRIGSKYWVYFAGHRKGASASGRSNDQCIGRASSNSPVGPYTPEAGPVYCGLVRGNNSSYNWWGRGALDPEVVVGSGKENGRRYLLVALSGTRSNIGALKLDSAGRVSGGSNANPTILARQSAGWHDGVDDSRLSSEAFLENPTMVYDAKSKTYLMYYSAGKWDSARYNTGFGRCSTPVGPCSVDLRGPTLIGGAGRTGPGGLTAFVDGSGALRAGYSSWTRGKEGPRRPSGDGGQYARHLTWARISVSGSNPKTQTVRLGAA